MATPPKPLLEPVPLYPLFEPNQLLSADQLNRLGDSLDQQTRRTRACLSGVGIICGLMAHKQGDGIRVSAGIGVTSEGYLVRQPAVTLGHYDDVTISRGLFLWPAASSSAELTVVELFATQGAERKPLTAAMIGDKILALVLEYSELAQAQCLVDCDEKGTERELKRRWFLLDKADAEAIALDGFNPEVDTARRRYPGWSLNALITGRWGLPDAYLQRFGCGALVEGKKPVSPLDIQDYKTLLARYSAMITAGKGLLDKALAEAHRALSPLFTETLPEPLPPLPAVRFDPGQLQDKRALEIQYVYAHLADLIRAYDELRACAFELMDACCDTAGWFPMYLLLGPVPDAGARPPIPPSPLRTPYAQPPIYNGNRGRVEAAWLLFERLRGLIGAFDLSPPIDARPIRITPSRWGDAPLGERAIPFYYKPEAELYRRWNPERHRRGRSQRTYSYEPVPHPNNAPFDQPLRYDFEGHDFYRIEGHVGRELGLARERILTLRQVCNLAFDVVEVKLGKQPNDEDFQHDCEFQLLQVLYAKLRTDLACALLKLKPTDEVKALLASLVESLDAFDFALFKARFDAVRALADPNQGCLTGYDSAAFAALAELHKTRRDEVLARTLLHRFAALHPGLEHRGGAPRGGTFVLVYDESPSPLTDQQKEQLLSRFAGEERKRLARLLEDDATAARFAVQRQTVVADFCLPYLCCSDCPPTAYVIARPRPTFAIHPMVFCADDETEYDFAVDPVGGVIMGPGTRWDGDRYWFVPNQTGVTEGNVKVVYSVDGADRELTLQINPVPQATFGLVPSQPCQGDEVLLRLAKGTPTGGMFTTDINANDPTFGLVSKDSETYLDPKQVPIDETFQVTYTVDNEHGCKGSSSREITIGPGPDSDFTGLKDAYCDNDNGSLLSATDSDLTSSEFSGEGVDDRKFLPSVVDLGERQQKSVVVLHRVVSAAGCTATRPKQTTVYRRPLRGEFEVIGIERADQQLVVELRAAGPEQPDGAPWEYAFSWGNADGDLVEGARTRDLDPIKLDIPLEGLELQKPLRLVMAIWNGPCEGPAAEGAWDIPGGDDGPAPEPDRPPLLDLAENRRLIALERLAALVEDNPGLDDNKPYREAEALLKHEGPAAEANELYAEFISAVAAGYARLGTDARKEAYRTITEIVTIAVVDRLAAEPADDILVAQAKDLIARIEAVELSPAAVRTRWLDDEMAAALEPARLERATALFG